MIALRFALPVAVCSFAVLSADEARPAAHAWTVADWSDWKLQETAPEGKMEILREIANAKPAKGAEPPGEEAVKAGVLVMGHSELLSVVRYEGRQPLPVDDYEISWEGLRVDGSDFFAALTFPVGNKETCATFVAGGWGGWTIGVSCIDGLFANENESTRSMAFAEGQWYVFTLQVNKHAIRALIDGEESFHVSLKGKTIAMHPSEVRKCVPLGFASFNTRGAVRNVRIRPLKPGELVAPE
jgi:hypothetical protein